MKQLKVFFALTISLLLISMFACEKESMLSDQELMTQEELITKQEESTLQSQTANERSSSDCFNFTTSNSAELGCACIPPPYVCLAEANFCNFGAQSFPVTIGNFHGTMTSVVTGLEQMGNPPTGNGALHLSLHHYFVTNDGNHAFWTNDQAVCAPAGSDPSSCIVNDVLNIAGGCGDFAGATGKFRNHGLLTFDGGAELCPIFYLEGGEDYVYTGALDFTLKGRICFDPE